MQVILLERIENLGKLGDVVRVKPGFARNFLLPKKKALRASADNIAQLEKQRAILAKQDDERRANAQILADKLNSVKITLVRAASEAGALFGSVSARDIKVATEEQGHKILASNILLSQPLKQLGEYTIKVRFHADVVADLQLVITKTQQEAK